MQVAQASLKLMSADQCRGGCVTHQRLPRGCPRTLLHILCTAMLQEPLVSQMPSLGCAKAVLAPGTPAWPAETPDMICQPLTSKQTLKAHLEGGLRPHRVRELRLAQVEVGHYRAGQDVQPRGLDPAVAGVVPQPVHVWRHEPVQQACGVGSGRGAFVSSRLTAWRLHCSERVSQLCTVSCPTKTCD
jgi:hypothetical protein